jgi:polysaccharide pyruvyl transferase WcaK-like protein
MAVMKIAIIGWYGTETIGDRAILAGLFSMFSKVFDNFEILLGSLYPFFSERTINEDWQFWAEITGERINISLFNSQNPKELDQYISKADLLCMGGGPLMDINELFMIEYAFKRAKKLGKKTALLGCGIGPLFHKKFKKSVLNIVKKSDIVILRDNKSKDNLSAIACEFNTEINPARISTSFDPAVECCLEFNRLHLESSANYIAVNLREFPMEYQKETKSKNINRELTSFIASLSDNFPKHVIKLIPMHYFHIGNDDRLFLNAISQELQRKNIHVQNIHLTLKETLQTYQDAYFNIGMRFHSVVFQTISSGKNYVLDYTEPRKGKIYGFLQDIDQVGFYAPRYISLQEEVISANIIQNVEAKFQFNDQAVKEKLDAFLDKLSIF